MTTSLRIPGRVETDRLRVWHALPPRKKWSLFTGDVGATGIQFSAGGKLDHDSQKGSHHILWDRVQRLDPGETHRFLSQFEVRSLRRMLLPGNADVSWEDLASIPGSIQISSEARDGDASESVQRRASHFRKESNPYDAIIAISSWLGENVKFDANSRHDISNVKSSLAYGRGNHEHLAVIFRQFCGELGIPVRTVRGLRLYEEDGICSNHAIRADSTNSHTWAEVYLPKIGWVEVEPASSQNPFLIGSHFIQNNHWIPNYAVEVRADGNNRAPKWTPAKEGFASEYHVEHTIEYRATPE